MPAPDTNDTYQKSLWALAFFTMEAARFEYVEDVCKKMLINNDQNITLNWKEWRASLLTNWGTLLDKIQKSCIAKSEITEDTLTNIYPCGSRISKCCEKAGVVSKKSVIKFFREDGVLNLVKSFS